MAIKRVMTSFRLAAVLALLLSGLGLVATAGPASASPAPGHTIKTAGTLAIPGTASGGVSQIDFWKVRLNGGDQIQLHVTVTVNPTENVFYFQLFAPGTTDQNFPSAVSFTSGTSQGTAKSVLDLQAPYNGTFILAVCENPAAFSCINVNAGGGGTNPMDPYTFTSSFATSIPSTVAAKEVQASPTIKGARALGLGNFQAGGAGAIDFWKVSLYGGDEIQLHMSVTVQPTFFTYYFQLFAPGTTDKSFPSAVSFSSGSSQGSAKSVANLEAPYNGTFILAVCEDEGTYSCIDGGGGGGLYPMNPYTFTPTVLKGVSAATAAKETKASPTIAGARALGLGNFEAGGAGPIDFWKIPLHGGDRIQLSIAPFVNAAHNDYIVQLFPPGTTDKNFKSATAVSSGGSDGKTKMVIDLLAPRTGTYVLAVCENPGSSNNCVRVDSGSGTNPMNPYTFTTKLIGGLESKTSLKLSAATVAYGHEKTLKFSVTVSALFGGTVTGKANVSDGKKAVCTLKLAGGKGSCAPTSNAEIAPGKYSVTAVYAGNKVASKSSPGTLTIKK
jgi:hypothetical protein